MDFNLYKNSWKLFLNSFSKLFSFTLAIIITLIACLVCYLFVSYYDAGIIAILLMAFVCVPLFYGYQLILARVSAGIPVEYNELYKGYKLYFNPKGRGAYNMISSFFVSMLVAILFIFLAITLYDGIYSGEVTKIIEEYSSFNEDVFSDALNKIINLPNILYYILGAICLSCIFFFSRLRKNLLLPYFYLSSSVPTFFLKSINKKVYQEQKNTINKLSRAGDCFFTLAFIVGFVVSLIISMIFSEQLEMLEYIIAISVSGGLLISSLFITPALINYCFIADKLSPVYSNMIKQQIIKTTRKIDEDDSIPPEKKEEFKKMFGIDVDEDQNED